MTSTVGDYLPEIEAQAIRPGPLAGYTPRWRVTCPACDTLYVCTCYADALEWQAYHVWACVEPHPPSSELGPCVCGHGPEEHAYLSQSGERWACECCDCDEYREDVPAPDSPLVDDLTAFYALVDSELADVDDCDLPALPPSSWPMPSPVAVLAGAVAAFGLLWVVTRNADPSSVLAIVHGTAGTFGGLALWALSLVALWRWARSAVRGS